MKYKGIILDFNGTLVWDTLLHKEAWFRFCLELGADITEKIYYNQLHGRTTKSILEFILKHKIDDEELQRLSHRKEALYRESCLEHPEIYRFAPGVEDFLDFISENNLPGTIATASEKINLDFFIETLNLDKWFDTSLFVYDDGSIKNKPEPDIYLKAAENLGILPEDLLVVEDTYYGVSAAKKAGAGCIVLTGPAEDRHDQLNSTEGIDLFITDFAEIDRNLFYV